MADEQLEEILAKGTCYNLFPLTGIAFAFLGQDNSKNYTFVPLYADQSKAFSRSYYEVVTIPRGTFISDGKEIILFEEHNFNQIINQIRRRLTDSEEAFYFMAASRESRNSIESA